MTKFVSCLVFEINVENLLLERLVCWLLSNLIVHFLIYQTLQLDPLQHCHFVHFFGGQISLPCSKINSNACVRLALIDSRDLPRA